MSNRGPLGARGEFITELKLDCVIDKLAELNERYVKCSNARVKASANGDIQKVVELNSELLYITRLISNYESYKRDLMGGK